MSLDLNDHLLHTEDSLLAAFLRDFLRQIVLGTFSNVTGSIFGLFRDILVGSFLSLLNTSGSAAVRLGRSNLLGRFARFFLIFTSAQSARVLRWFSQTHTAGLYLSY